MSDVPRVDVEVTQDNVLDTAIQILKVIKPLWDKEHIKYKVFTDGITNKLYGWYLDGHFDDVVLLRVYGEKTDLFIDRAAEVRNIQLLHKAGRAPKLYAMFANGLAYEFVPGSVLTVVSCRDPEIFPLVSEEMAALHQVEDDTPKVAVLWKKLRHFFELVPDEFPNPVHKQRYPSEFPPKADLLKEIDELEDILTRLGSPLVFCHNDLLLGNVIYDSRRRKVTFIDYEYAAYNYLAYDIANHFNEYAGVDNVDYARYPDRSFQMEWLKCYLQASGIASTVSENDVLTLYSHVNKFALASHLFWSLWALVQTVHSSIDFDFFEYAVLRYKEYQNRKVEFLSL